MTPSDRFRLRRIAGYPAVMLDLQLGSYRVQLCTVPDLEELVDRDALLRGDIEPPYWAYLWSGARVLASYLADWVDLRGRRVLEIGCGLGLPGVTAAVLGADVTLVDAEPAALEFVAVSAAANQVRCTPVVGDFMRLDPGWRFDVVLAAEVAYDRGRFAELAAVFERHLLPGGVALLADGYRTDSRGLYRALADLGLEIHAVDLRVVEEARPLPSRLTLIRRLAERVRPRGTPPDRSEPAAEAHGAVRCRIGSAPPEASSEAPTSGAGGERVESLEDFLRSPCAVASAVRELDEDVGFFERLDVARSVVGRDAELTREERRIDDGVAREQVGDTPCGGVAACEPHMTQDVDVLVERPLSRVDPLVRRDPTRS